MASVTPIWASVHAVDGTTGKTTFSADVEIDGAFTNASTGAAPLVLTTAVAQAPVLGAINSLTTTFATLTSAYGTASDATRTLDVALNTDTSAFGYGGITNAFIAHVNVNAATGASLFKVEAIAGVVNLKAGSGADLSSGGYGTAGEFLHNSTQNITGTLYGTIGDFTTFSSGSFATTYGAAGIVSTVAGQTGTYTTLAQGVLGRVAADGAVAIAAATGASGEVFPSSTGSTTGITQGVLAWVHNTSTYTYTGAVYGLSALVNIAGAAVASGVVHAAQIVNLFGGTTAGGTTNVAMNAEIQWGSSTVPTGNLIAGQFRNRVSANAVVGTSDTIRVMAPVFANSGTMNLHRGMHILNQGSSSITTSTALLIDAQSGSGTNVALNILGGSILFGTVISTYNNIALDGNGIPSIVKRTRPAQQTNTTVTLAAYTAPAADGTYEISANINVTTSTTVTMTVTCAYTDESNVARTMTLPFFLLNGTSVVSITTAQGNIAYASMPIKIRVKASTSITIATAGTVTSVVYTGEGIIRNLA